MMQHVLRYFLVSFTFLLFTSTFVWAKTDLTCADSIQNNGTAPWACPMLPYGDTEMTAALSDVDVESGKYTCEYHYADSAQVATACTYISKDYKDNLAATRVRIRDDIVKAISGSNISILSFRNNYFANTLGTNAFNIVDLATDIPVLDDTLQAEIKVEGNISRRISQIIFGKSGNDKHPDGLKKYIHIVDNAHGRVADLYKYLEPMGTTTVNNPNDALKESYEYFVKPYTPNGGSKRDINTTFSRFITGMVTLDDNVVKGYTESNSSLIINGNWNVSRLLDANITDYYDAENKRNNGINIDTYNVKGWVNIFTQKIWGFYYNLQRRFDLGYDVISTELLFIMMVFFAMSMAVRGGARYITNRENGHSSGEVKINEASIMKTLGILATVFAFYISVPSAISSTLDGSNPTEDHDLNSYEMHTNNSLSKALIRYAMQEGSYFGTMMSDLGTDAFLHYLVYKQGLNNTERNNVIESMMSLAYYFPAKQIVDTCRVQYGMSDVALATASGHVAISKFFSEKSNNIPLIEDSNALSNTVPIVELSDSLCQKMTSRTTHKLTEVLFDFEALYQMIQKDMYVRLNATYSMVMNHIKLQKDLGWMNIASIPYTYFIMKNQDLFFESSIDYDEIAKKTEKYTRNLGLRDSTDSLNNTLWVKNIKESKSRVADAQSSAKDTQSEYTRFAVYNFLPGFSSIRNEVLQRIQSLYSDILRIRTKEDTSKLEHFRKLLYRMIETSQRYYKNTKIDIAEIKRLIGVGIPNGKVESQNPVKLHTAFIKLSYLVAMSIWKNGFIIVFLSAIAMIIGLKIVMYIIHVMIHFFISPFIVIWAFATSPDGGAAKIKNYLRDTLIYMLYPSIIVMGVFMFIFSYELFYSIYGFITATLISGQETNISNAILAADPSRSTVSSREMGYLAIYSLKDITEILIDLLSVYVAFLTINKFPELVLKMMGVSDSAVIMLPQASEAIQSKGGGNVSPLSR